MKEILSSELVDIAHIDAPQSDLSFPEASSVVGAGLNHLKQKVSVLDDTEPQFIHAMNSSPLSSEINHFQPQTPALDDDESSHYTEKDDVSSGYSSTDQSDVTLADKHQESPISSDIFMGGPVATSVGDLCVRGLAWCTTDESMEQYFSQFGKVSLCAVKKERDGRSKGYGFVNFVDVASIDEVLSQSHIIDGRQVEIRPPRERQDPGAVNEAAVKDAGSLTLEGELSRKCFIGLIPASTTEEDLHDHFSKFGEVSAIYLPRPMRGFGFVTFKDQNGACAALQQKDSHLVNGAKLEVKAPIPKQHQGKPKKFQKSTSPAESVHSWSSFDSWVPISHGQYLPKHGSPNSWQSYSSTVHPAMTVPVPHLHHLDILQAACMQMAQLQLQSSWMPPAHHWTYHETMHSEYPSNPLAKDGATESNSESDPDGAEGRPDSQLVAPVNLLPYGSPPHMQQHGGHNGAMYNFAPVGRQHCLLVSNIHYSASWQDIRDLFGIWGSVLRVDVVRDERGLFKGKAMVVFSCAEEAKNALKLGQNLDFKGRKLIVKEDDL